MLTNAKRSLPSPPFFFQVLLARLDYLRRTHQIREGDFLNFDALRQAAQCVGRVVRSKTDYGIMCFVDKRYNQPNKRGKLPPWIGQFLDATHLNLSTEEAVGAARHCRRFGLEPKVAAGQQHGEHDAAEGITHGNPLSESHSHGHADKAEGEEHGGAMLQSQPGLVAVVADFVGGVSGANE